MNGGSSCGVVCGTRRSLTINGFGKLEYADMKEIFILLETPQSTEKKVKDRGLEVIQETQCVGGGLRGSFYR